MKAAIGAIHARSDRSVEILRLKEDFFPSALDCTSPAREAGEAFHAAREGLLRRATFNIVIEGEHDGRKTTRNDSFHDIASPSRRGQANRHQVPSLIKLDNVIITVEIFEKNQIVPFIGVHI